MTRSGVCDSLHLTNPVFSVAARVAVALVLCCAPSLSLATAVQSGSEAPRQQPVYPHVAPLLETMGVAGRERDYEGIFTYEYAGMLKSVKVTHVVRDGVEYVRWFHLNGPPQEILRLGSHCGVNADSNLDRVTKPAINHERMSGYYDFQLWGEDRVADRLVWVLHLVPRDAHRYGFVLSVDKQSGLLLQSLLLDGNRRVLERFQYLLVNYEVDDATASELIAAAHGSAGGGNSHKREHAPSDTGCAAEIATTTKSRWQTGWLPPGFQLMSRSGGAGEIESLLFSDGLSVFSVFLDPRGSAQLPEVQAQRGATVAQLARVEADGKNYLVSVVGEIPLETAQRVAGFVRHGAEE